MLKAIESLIGNTPMIKLRKLENDMADIYVKLESYNPSGSIKDRAALYMINAAETEGELEKGGTIIEPTSGNTGVALAMIGASRGYKVILVMPDTMSIERRKLMKAYGAEIILTEGKYGMFGSVELAENLAKNKGYFMPNQFENYNNVTAHYETTGVEIIEEMNGKIHGFIAGVGTGGTVTGVGKRLKEYNKDILIVAVQPKKSPVLTGGNPQGHKVQGIGANFIPKIFNRDLIDEIVDIEDEKAYKYSREIGKREGILIGISAGANLAAAQIMAKRLGRGKNIVTVLPDSGERYLSTDLYKWE